MVIFQRINPSLWVGVFLAAQLASANGVETGGPFKPNIHRGWVQQQLLIHGSHLKDFKMLTGKSVKAVSPSFDSNGPWSTVIKNQYDTPHNFLKRRTLPQKRCDGKKNLVDDFGIISLIISAFSTFVGFGLDLILSFKGNMIAIVSKFFALLFGVPAALITAFNISNPLVYFVSNGLNILSFATTFFGASSLDVGNAGLVTDLFFEFLGIVGLVLSIFSTFPTLFDDVIEGAQLWGIGNEVKNFIENYGCGNPYNTQEV